MTDNPGGGPDMTIPHGAGLAHADATLVLDIAEIAEEQLGETEDERNLRVRFQEALQSLSWDLTAPWSEHTVSADRVLRTPGGDLDELRVAEFLDRVLRRGESAAAARHGMDRELKLAKIMNARSGVVSRLHALGEREHAREGSPVHRHELPPSEVAPPVQAPAPLPKRVRQHPLAGMAEPITPMAPPMYPPAPPESPLERTGAMVARHIEAMRLAGEDVEAAEVAAALLPRRAEGAGVPDFGPGAPAEFGPGAIPQQRAGDTQRLQMDEVLGHLGMDDAGAGDDASAPLPFPVASTAVAGSRPGVAAAGSGRGDSDDA